MNHFCYYFDDPWKVKVLCYYHVTYTFQSEYILCSCLNVKKHLPRNRRDIWSLRECHTDKYSQRKCLRAKWLWVWIPLMSHIVLCLNAFSKLQNARGVSRQPVLMGNSPTCLYVLALLFYWMFCYQLIPGVVQGMRFCGHETGASWVESWQEIDAGKRTQKYSKHEKERCWHTKSLDW